jgi:hypothetical protein
MVHVVHVIRGQCLQAARDLRPLLVYYYILYVCINPQ